MNWNFLTRYKFQSGHRIAMLDAAESFQTQHSETTILNNIIHAYTDIEMGYMF